MFSVLRTRIVRERIARVSGDPVSDSVLTPRSRIALTAGFIVAVAGATLIATNVNTVWAQADDHAAFWRAERARQAAARQTRTPTPAQRPLKSAKRESPPKYMSSYAPLPQVQVQRAPTNPFWFFTQRNAAPAPAPAGANPPLAGAPKNPTLARKASGPRSPRMATSRHVCVRLCDGYFFPAPTGTTASEAACAAACPDAPTRLYSMRSDRINDAVSHREGHSYAKLPSALRYTRTREQTCSCGPVDPTKAIMADASLRPGDRFMTEEGFLIYQGGNRKQIAQRDFKRLAEVRGIPKHERNLLVAMERVSIPKRAQQLAATPSGSSHVALGRPARIETIALR